jgi:hypothetical protein
MRLAVVLIALAAGGCGGGDTCESFISAYCANASACSNTDACPAEFHDQIVRYCRAGIEVGKATAGDFDACAAHLREGKDCGDLSVKTNPCAGVAPALKPIACPGQQCSVGQACCLSTGGRYSCATTCASEDSSFDCRGATNCPASAPICCLSSEPFMKEGMCFAKATAVCATSCPTVDAALSCASPMVYHRNTLCGSTADCGGTGRPHCCDQRFKAYQECLDDAARAALPADVSCL